MSADRLTSQLNYLPHIIGRMGLNIAEAQQEFNLDYVRTLHRILDLIKRMLDAPAANGATSTPEKRQEAVNLLIKQLAPSRYQFTEATIDFSADLAESKDFGGSVGVGFGLGAVTVSAGMSVAYGYDYRAAARITAKLHAIAADDKQQAALIARAKEIDTTHKGTLPPAKQVDKELLKELAATFKTASASEIKIEAAEKLE